LLKIVFGSPGIDQAFKNKPLRVKFFYLILFVFYMCVLSTCVFTPSRYSSHLFTLYRCKHGTRV